MRSVMFLITAVLAVVAVQAAKIEEVSVGPHNGLSEVTLASMAQKAGLGIKNGFRLTHPDTMVDSGRGVQRSRLGQTYGGLDVYGVNLVADFTMEGQLTGQVYGQVARNLEADVEDTAACDHQVEDMIDLAVAKEDLHPQSRNLRLKSGKKLVYLHRETGKGHLAYRVQFFYANGKDNRNLVYFIDACTLEVLHSFNTIEPYPIRRHGKLFGANPVKEEAIAEAAESCVPSAAGIGGNPVEGKFIYNVPPRCLAVNKTGTSCVMQTKDFFIVDNKQSSSEGITTPIKFTCSKGYSDPKNGAYGVASDVMYFAGQSYEFFRSKYNMQMLKKGPKVAVHYGNCYENAFYVGGNLYLGDGCSYFYPLDSLDVVAHELGHGVTADHSNLEYAYQSGGINEAFSDICGVSARYFATGKNDWMIGHDIMKHGGALRWMSDPTKDGRSIKMVKDYYKGLNPHYSSGVYNYVFYALVRVHGMRLYNAFHAMLYANMHLWGYTTNYKQGACGVLQAAYTLGYSATPVNAAFKDVGLDLSDCKHSALKTTIAVGQTHKQIVVSADRNPVIEVDVRGVQTATVQALAEDMSPVTLTIATDDFAVNAIATASKSIKIDSSSHDYIYVKLSTSSSEELKVTLNVL